ncbi:MAG: low molecular weight protein arginine phosphatase [Clostridia bacterium]|nr:low molecular weight protein arginine phosphatase [Clostridia bacterium]
MAAALMNKIASENDIDAVSQSAGIFAEPGQPASENAVIAMEDYGIDLSGHISRQITDELVTDADLVLTMTEGHKMLTAGLAPEKTFTICEFAGYDGEISDPFGGDVDEYKSVAREIYDCLTDIAEKIVDIFG